LPAASQDGAKDIPSFCALESANCVLLEHGGKFEYWIKSNEMAGIIKWSVFVLALSQSFISPVYAGLPDITAAELLKAVKHGDSLYKNIDCKYTIDEQHNKNVWGESGIPLKRKLEIHWRAEGVKDYFDVTTHDGRFVLGKPVRYVRTFNGKIRMQWSPDRNKGSIFKKRYISNWSVPIHFGLTLGNREKKLGESLAVCEITSLRQKKWQGHECYFIEAIQSDGTKAEVWIDPKIGWRARRLRMWDPDGLILRYSSEEFKDCGNGSWYPVEGIYRYYADDKSSGERVISIERKLKVEQVEVNADLTIKDFEIQYPRGTRVHLYDTGESYIAGVTSVAGFGEEALNPLKDKPLPDLKQFAILQDPNQTRDKMILVCFFDMDQRPSRNCMRQLSAKAQELKAKGVFVVAVHALKVDDNKLRVWLQKYKISFPVGMIKANIEKTRIAWGINSLPRLILTDKKHIVTAEGFSLAELDEKLDGKSH
jgi:hypothetical protein